MLEIRQDQIDLLSNVALARHVQKIMRDIEIEHAEGFAKDKPRPQLSTWVTAQVNSAQKLGFQSIGEIKRYVNVAILMGSNFVEEPWAQKIFAQDIFPSTKVALLEEHANNETQELFDKRERIAKKKRKLLRAQFCTKNIPKLIAVAPSILHRKLTSEQAFDWLLNLSTTAFITGCKDMIELDLWLDLSLIQGEDFYRTPEFHSMELSALPINQKLNLYAKGMERKS